MHPNSEWYETHHPTYHPTYLPVSLHAFLFHSKDICVITHQLIVPQFLTHADVHTNLFAYLLPDGISNLH
jgi:hypothetical protein